ncbi:MAG: HAD family hydrolase [Bacteroidetes bacterium]|nr:HAD family hydrolase [Bacteroidota bacterium]
MGENYPIERIRDAFTFLMWQYDFFLLDLDNTLYDEKQYLYPVYQAISKRMAKAYSLNETEMTDFFLDTFEKEGRGSLFNKLCEQFHIPEQEISGMLITMREIILVEKIQLNPVGKLVLDLLVEERKKIFIVTNGNVAQQKNKVSLIDWGESFSYLNFVYANLYQSKPNRASFDFLQKEFSVLPEKTIMIGDSQTDEEFAKNSGIQYVPVQMFSM